MGVFSALTTAVSGMTAQSYALENISGNIANSRTAGYKRVDTAFADLVPDAALRRQVAGSVQAFSQATNSIQGDLNPTRIDTNIAINGDGFFVVDEQKLRELKGKALQDLAKSGDLGWIYAHLLSLANVELLSKVLDKQAPPAATH